MKQWNQVAIALCLAAATAACAGEREAEPVRDEPSTVGTAGNEGAAADVNANVDRDFIAAMMADGRKEIELGKLAQQKARNQQVKDFAAMMVQDHTKAGEELRAAATRANVQPANVDADMEELNDLRERLSKLSGMEFDREYIKAMVEDHDHAVDEVSSKAEGSGNEHLKAWAAQTLPVLKKHHERAKQLHEMLDKRSET